MWLNCSTQEAYIRFEWPEVDSSGGAYLMTALEVAFRYGAPPNESTMRALDNVREVYGIRRLVFQSDQNTVRVEYDASRLTDSVVAGLLRGAGLDVREKLALA